MVVSAALQETLIRSASAFYQEPILLYFKIKTLCRKKVDDVLLTGGGIIPQDDMEQLQKAGVGKLFSPGAPTREIVDYIRDWVKENRSF